MGMLDAALTGYGFYNQMQNLGDMADKVGTTISGLETTLPQYSQFKPYTVTTGVGNIAADPTGGYTATMSESQKANARQLAQGGLGLLNRATQDIAPRTQELYGQMTAAMQPEMERQRLQNEQRALAQGQTGLSSNMYGGTDATTFGLNKAQQEAMANAYLGARQNALAEQAQQATIGSGMFGQSYLPFEKLMSTITPALQGSQIATQAGGTTADILGQLGLGGLTAQANLEKIRSELMGQGLGMLSNSLAGTPFATGVNNLVGSIGSGLGNYLSGLFGGSSPVDAQGNTAGTNITNLLNAGAMLGGGFESGGSAGNNVMSYLQSLGSNSGSSTLGDLLGYSQYTNPNGYDSSGIMGGINFGTTSGGVNLGGVGGNDYLGFGSYDPNQFNVGP